MPESHMLIEAVEKTNAAIYQISQNQPIVQAWALL